MQQSSRAKTKQKSRTDAAGTIRAGQSRLETPGAIIEHIADNDITYYENRITEAIEDYKRENNIDSITSLKQLQYNSVLIYIGKTVFTYNGKKLLNYRDIQLLYDLLSIYCNISNRFNKTISVIGFSYFINLDISVLSKWKHGTNRSTIYYDIDTNKIIDSSSITLYRMHYADHSIMELSNNLYSNLVKKIDQLREDQLKNKTEDGSIPALALGKIEYSWIEGGEKQLQAKLIESYVQPSNLLDKYE